MFEEYCALAEFVAEDASQVSFKPGDKVLVMSKDESGVTMMNTVAATMGGLPNVCNRHEKGRKSYVHHIFTVTNISSVCACACACMPSVKECNIISMRCVSLHAGLCRQRCTHTFS